MEHFQKMIKLEEIMENDLMGKVTITGKAENCNSQPKRRPRNTTPGR